MLGASLVAQLLKNPPAMQDTPIQFLGQEDTLEKGQATHFSIPGFPGGLEGKESVCSAGDLGLIPRLEDPPEDMATYLSILACRIPMDRGVWWLQSMGSQRI